jgi:hypothetical protein
MAIWNQNYDQNSYVTKGYQLPTREIIGAIGAKTNYFLDSANKLANEYNNTFDFNLSNDANKSRLQQQKAEIDEKMKGLVKKDLTISDNSAAIRNLYKPVMQDQSYLMDEALTNKISSGFQQAQSDLKKNGADHYNMKSIQVLNETLEDWKKDNPANIEKYTSDTLGTTYQPYDPKVDKEFQKTIQDRVKSGKIKVDVKDGQGNIITQEYADLNSVQAQEYIREIRPQQQVVQDQLDAKLYGNRLRKSSPEERGQLLSSIQGIQKYNVDKQVAYIDNERHKVEANYALQPKDEQENGKKAYEASIEQYKDIAGKAKAMYSTFDDNAYFDPNKRNLSQNQLETILNQRSINALVDGMGLESNSRTIKSDVAFWNAQNLEFNRTKLAAENDYRKADLAIKAAKLKGKEGGADGENSNIQPASDVASLGTQGLDPERKAEVISKEIQTQLRGELETKKSGIASNLFSQLGVTVNNPDGFGNTDFFSALDKANPNDTLETLLSSITGGSETNKNLIKILVNEGAKKLTNGKLYKEKTLPTISLREAKMDIKAALENPEIFNSAIKKAGIDTGNFNAADYLGYQSSQIHFDEKTQEQKYGRAYKEAAKQIIPNAESKTFDQLKYYNEEQYVKDISSQLSGMGLSSKDINDFSKYLKGEDVNNPKVKAVTSTSPYDDGLSPFTGRVGLNPILSKFEQNWKQYQKSLNSNIAKISQGASNYNTTTFQLTDKAPSEKSFDPSVHYNKAAFQTLITNNSSGANAAGETKDADFVKKVQQFVNTDKDIISGFAPYSDGDTNFITLKINRNKDNDKVIKEAGLDPDELTNTKIYIDKPAIERLGFKPQSRATSDLQKGRIFGANTQSGNSFSFYNVGDANNMKINYDGSFLMTAGVGGVFSIKQPTLGTYIKSTGKEDAIHAGGADVVASHVYQLDADAKRVTDILRKYKVDFSGEKNITFAQLPEKAKEELRAKTLQFKNQRD